MSIFNTPPSTTDPLKLLQSFQEKRDASKGGVNGIMSDSNSNTDVDDFVASYHDALNNRRVEAMNAVEQQKSDVLASYTAPASASNDDTLMASLESQSEVDKLLRSILRKKRKKTESYGEENDSVTKISPEGTGVFDNTITTGGNSAGEVVEGPPYNAERMIEINTAGEVVDPVVDGLMGDPRELGGSEGYGSLGKPTGLMSKNKEALEGPEALLSGSKQVLLSLTETLSSGSKGNAVMNAQLRLSELGYDIGRGGTKGLTRDKSGKWVSLDNSELRGVDSAFGGLTEKAVMAFQKDAGLPVTGSIDPDTAKALANKEEVEFRIPKGFTNNYSDKRKENFNSAKDAAIAAGLKGAELASFMSQVAHESDDFRTAEEYASGAAYEGRTDLGNNQVGDGKKFKGRGYIQLTGRSNYEKAGKDLGLDLVNNPSLAEKPENAAAISIWFWETKVQPIVPDFMDTERVTKVVNGGFNGLDKRKKYFNKFLKQGSDTI